MVFLSLSSSFSAGIHTQKETLTSNKSVYEVFGFGTIRKATVERFNPVVVSE
jgi:hypothetical protein